MGDWFRAGSVRFGCQYRWVGWDECLGVKYSQGRSSKNLNTTLQSITITSKAATRISSMWYVKYDRQMSFASPHLLNKWFIWNYVEMQHMWEADNILKTDGSTHSSILVQTKPLRVEDNLDSNAGANMDPESLHHFKVYLDIYPEDRVIEAKWVRNVSQLTPEHDV